MQATSYSTENRCNTLPGRKDFKRLPVTSGKDGIVMIKKPYMLISSLLLACCLGAVWLNNAFASRLAHDHWALKEVKFITGSASTSDPGKLKVVVTEKENTPANATVTLLVSFQVIQGAPVSIKIDPDEILIAGRNKGTSEAREFEITFSIPKDQVSGASVVKAVATLHNPVNSTINNDAADVTSSNQLIINKSSL